VTTAVTVCLMMISCLNVVSVNFFY